MKKSWSRLIAYTTRGVVSVVILVVGFGVFDYFKATRPEVPRSQAGAGNRLVEVMVAQPVSTTRIWEGFGTAEARYVADVASEVSGLVVSRPENVEPGHAVTRGQTLIVLDDRDYLTQQEIARQNMEKYDAQLRVLDIEEKNWTDQLALAREELAVARNEYDQTREAQSNGAGSPIEVDRRRREYTASLRIVRQLEEEVDKIAPRRSDLQASRQLEVSRAEIAARDVQRCTIASPIDGVLQFVNVQDGERVIAGTVVARVVNLDLIRIPLQLPQSAQASVRVGDPVLLKSDTMGWCWGGRVERLAPEADASTRTLVAFAEVSQDKDADPLLIPGRFVHATVSSPAVERFVVPRRALVGDAVMVDDGGVAIRRRVNVEYHIRQTFNQLHPSEQEWVVLAADSGLQRGDRVILSNVDEIRPGEKLVSTDATDANGLSRLRAADEPNTSPADR